MQRKLLKRNWMLFIVLALVFILILGACSGNGNNGNSGNSENTETNAPSDSKTTESTTSAVEESDDPFAEHLEITWVGYNVKGVVYPEGDYETKKLIEEQFNVTLITPQLDIFNDEQVNLFFAEGNEVDFFTGKTQLHENLIDQGVFQSINLDEARKKMPNWFEQLEREIDYDTMKSALQYKGENWSIPLGNYSSYIPHVMGIREDWLKNLGITTTPTTLDEFTEVLRKFTFDDPDQNGENDTYGTNGIGTYVYAAFGIPVSGDLALSASGVPFYADDNGKVNPVATSDNKKAFLKQVAAWYKEGLIDPEILTDKRAEQRSKWKEGKFGILGDHPWWFAPSTNDNLRDMVKALNPDAVVSIFEPFEGPFGKGTSGRTYAPIWHSQYFGAGASQAKVDRIMAIKEAIASDGELYLRLTNGVEGEHYDINEDGIIIAKDSASTGDAIAAEGLGTYFSQSPITFEFASKYIFTEIEVADNEVALNADYYPHNVNFAYSGTNPAFSEKRGELRTLENEFDIKAISGSIDIDAEWDNFVKNYMDAGGQAAADGFQKLYDESN